MDTCFIAFTRLAFGYWEGQPLYTLAELGIPTRLTEPRTCAELALGLGCEPEPLERLLGCAVAQKLLVCRDNLYSNSEISTRFLTEDSPESLLYWLRIMDRWKQPWARLADAVRSGMAVDDQYKWLGEDPHSTRHFILGMHQYASRSCQQFVEATTNIPFASLVDVGGGAGTYSIALCAERENLKAIVLDLAPVVEVARQTINMAGLSSRISTQVVDYRKDSFGEDADALLFSNVLHQESAEVCSSMLARARSALRRGGVLLVQGYFLAEDRRAPLFATLHNLSALALWNGGRSWTVAEMQTLIAAAGFEGQDVLLQENSGFTLLSATNN